MTQLAITLKARLETLLVVLVAICILTSTSVTVLQKGPDEWILTWVDEEAKMADGDRYLHGDPAMHGIYSIMITFDPDIEQNNLFWILAELRIQDVDRISQIRWVKGISLIKTGRYERIVNNPKLAVKGIEWAIQRAAKARKSLEIIVYLTGNGSQVMIEELTGYISSLGGVVLRTGTYLNKLLVRIPAENILKLTEHPYVREIYNQGPVVFQG